jgi:hypothetical protein
LALQGFQVGQLGRQGDAQLPSTPLAAVRSAWRHVSAEEATAEVSARPSCAAEDHGQQDPDPVADQRDDGQDN